MPIDHHERREARERYAADCADLGFVPLMTRIGGLVAELRRATEAATKANDARGALPPGSSRARVTSANAKAEATAEHRERVRDQLEVALAEAQRRGLIRVEAA
jgi:hypothetical protein